MKFYVVNINEIWFGPTKFMDYDDNAFKSECNYYFYDKKQALNFANNFQYIRTNRHETEKEKFKDKNIQKLTSFRHERDIMQQTDFIHSIRYPDHVRPAIGIYELEIQKPQTEPIVYYIVGINSIGRIYYRRINVFDSIRDLHILTSYQINPHQKVGKKGHKYASLISLDYAEKIVQQLYNNKLTPEQAIQQEKIKLQNNDSNKNNNLKSNQEPKDSLDFIEL